MARLCASRASYCTCTPEPPPTLFCLARAHVPHAHQDQLSAEHECARTFAPLATDEFVARTFIGSLSADLRLTRRTVRFELNGPEGNGAEACFLHEDTCVESVGFGGACPWVLRDVGVMGKGDVRPHFGEGESLPVQRASADRHATQPPPFLQEHELIECMDSHRIGTDASMAIHVANLVDRGYVVVCDQTGVPLRPLRPPRAGTKPLPRQIGRYMVPTPLGIQLLSLFDAGGVGDLPSSAALLAQPAIRARMEGEVKQIASGTLSKDQVVGQNLEWFNERYCELEASLTRDRVAAFAEALQPIGPALKHWRRLGAFQEGTEPVPKSNRQQATPRHPATTRGASTQKTPSGPRRRVHTGRTRRGQPRRGRGTLARTS